MRADIYWEAHGAIFKEKEVKMNDLSLLFECRYYTPCCYRGSKEETAEDDLLNTDAVWRSVQTNRWRGKCQRLPVMAAVFCYLQPLLCSPLNKGSRQRMMEMASEDRKGLRGEDGRASRVWATCVGKILVNPSCIMANSLNKNKRNKCHIVAGTEGGLAYFKTIYTSVMSSF